MCSETPKIPQNNKAYALLQERRIADFNSLHQRGQIGDDLSGLAFRGFDLRGLDAENLNLADCKFKQADLRGINFSSANLNGSSLYGTKISGCLFPAEFSAAEILMSVTHGTRLRKS